MELQYYDSVIEYHNDYNCYFSTMYRETSIISDALSMETRNLFLVYREITYFLKG